MLSRIIALLLLATSATFATQISPVFFLASTADLPIEAADLEDVDPPTSQVTNLLWRSLAQCPTTHYAVIVEPRTLSYTHAFIPEVPDIKSEYFIADMEGQVNINHVLNTILMDCLHYGVLRVEELDTSRGNLELPSLSTEVIRKSIMFAQYPETETDMDAAKYLDMMAKRKVFVERMVREYFNNDDYTLIYVRERETRVGSQDIRIGEKEDGAEVPFVHEH